MRQAFVKTLVDLAEKNPQIVLLTADLGYTVLEPFRDKFPERYFNVGVAEQNMIGVATGLAAEGWIPYVYSIAPFVSLRPYEFIRNGPILHQLPVRIVGVGGGFDYGAAGPTHHALEDVGVMRIHPGIEVIVPADHEQARSAVVASWNRPGPVYLRLGKEEKFTLPGLDGCYETGRAQFVREGKDVLLIAMGPIASEAVAAAETLQKRGIQCGLVVVSCVNPAPVADLVEALGHVPVALTVESHYINGGLGSLVCEVVAESGLACRVVRCGVKTTPVGTGGSQVYMEKRHQLSREALVDTVLKNL